VKDGITTFIIIVLFRFDGKLSLIWWGAESSWASTFLSSWFCETISGHHAAVMFRLLTFSWIGFSVWMSAVCNIAFHVVHMNKTGLWVCVW